MKKLALTRGKFALVTDEDYDWIISQKSPIRNRPRKYFAVPHGVGFCAARHSDNPTRKLIYLHREIYERHYGLIPEGMEIDHKNRDALDDRPNNLRLATDKQNSYNRSVNRYKKSCSLLGVTKHHRTKTWNIQIVSDGKRYHLGCLPGVEYYKIFAGYIHDWFAIQFHGEHASLNFSKKNDEFYYQLLNMMYRPHNISRYRCVKYCHRNKYSKWTLVITNPSGKRITFGCFKDKEVPARIHDIVMLKWYGYPIPMNFPEDKDNYLFGRYDYLLTEKIKQKIIA